MQRLSLQLVLLAIVLLLAGVAAWSGPSPFLPALTLVASGALACGFVARLEPALATGNGTVASLRGGTALLFRVLVGALVLAIMLASALWGLGRLGG